LSVVPYITQIPLYSPVSRLMPTSPLPLLSRWPWD